MPTRVDNGFNDILLMACIRYSSNIVQLKSRHTCNFVDINGSLVVKINVTLKWEITLHRVVNVTNNFAG